MCFPGKMLTVMGLLFSTTALAQEAGGSGGVPDVSPTPTKQKAPPAPLGVFGSDIAAVGKFSVGFSGVFTGLANSRIGTKIVSPEYIVSTTPWFFDPRKPVRLVPSSVFATIQSISFSYGVAENFGIVLAAGAVEKRVAALTYAAPSGTRFLGQSYATVAGVTDLEAAAVLRIYRDEVHRVLISLGLTFPTGSNESQFRLLLSDGAYGTVRAFYSMQPGTGTYDFLPGFTYGGVIGRYSWGIAYRGRWPLASNPEGYRYGDLHDLHGWIGYSWIPELTTTLRVTGTTRGPIRGFDPKIDGKSQSANPFFYGGQRVELYGGATIAGSLLGLDRATFAIEAGMPIYQNLNGPQLFRNWQAIVAVRISL
ncbi:MAG: alpha-amylase [Methylocystis sp.]|nr:MAG: alpha-amylase [Methylocystis sp.]